MKRFHKSSSLRFAWVLLVPLILTACGGSGDGDDSTAADDGLSQMTGEPPDPIGTGVPAADGTGEESSDGMTAGEPPDATGTDVPVAGENGGGDGQMTGTGTENGPEGAPSGPTDEPVVAEPQREAFDGASELVRALAIERFTVANYRQVLGAVVRLSDLDDVVLMARELRELEADVRDGTSPLRPINIVEPPFNRLHICPDGGRLLSTVGDTSAAGQHVFDGCRVGGRIYTGQYLRTVDRTDNFRETSSGNGYLFIGTTIEEASGRTRSLTGQVNRIDQIAPTESVTFLGTPSMDITDADGVGIRLARAVIDGRAPAGDAQALDGTTGAKVRTIGTSVRVLPRGGNTISVSTVTAFAADSTDGDFQQGQLVVSLSDRDNQGNRIVMQVANGDPGSFDVFLFEDDDSVQSFTIDWSDEFRFGRPLRLPD